MVVLHSHAQRMGIFPRSPADSEWTDSPPPADLWIYCLFPTLLFTDSLHKNVLRRQMVWQNLWQLIKEGYRFLPKRSILMWSNGSFCHDSTRKRCCWELLPSVKSSIMSCALFLKRGLVEMATYRLSTAYCFCHAVLSARNTFSPDASEPSPRSTFKMPSLLSPEASLFPPGSDNHFFYLLEQ